MNLILRLAIIGDAELLFDWRNDPQTRADSVNTEKVEWAGHVSWFDRSLINQGRKIFIALDGEMPVGTIRLDDDPDEMKTEMSWTVAPEARGKGYGKELVRLGVERVQALGRIPVARIKRENEASLRIVQSLGFKQVSQDGPLTFWEYQSSSLR